MPKSGSIVLLLMMLVLLHAACSKKVKTQKPVSLDPVKSISAFNDSTFFGNIQAIKFTNNRVYLSDNMLQVFQLSTRLKLLGRIHKSGKGPGEFTNISAMSVANDSLFLYDRAQAKVLVYDDNNHFVREAALPDASGMSIAVDKHSQIFLSTPDRKYPVTKLNAHGQEIKVFGKNTVGRHDRHFRRNQRVLFIHNGRLFTVANSEPVVEVYSLNGTLINTTKLDPPEIHNLIGRVKKENEDIHHMGLSIIFYGVTMYKDVLYVMEAKHPEKNTNTYDRMSTYLFKYRLQEDGHITFVRTFKLFRSDHHKLLYGFRMVALGDHKLLVYDLKGKNLLVFKDKRL